MQMINWTRFLQSMIVDDETNDQLDIKINKFKPITGSRYIATPAAFFVIISFSLLEIKMTSILHTHYLPNYSNEKFSGTEKEDSNHSCIKFNWIIFLDRRLRHSFQIIPSKRNDFTFFTSRRTRTSSFPDPTEFTKKSYLMLYDWLMRLSVFNNKLSRSANSTKRYTTTTNTANSAFKYREIIWSCLDNRKTINNEKEESKVGFANRYKHFSPFFWSSQP